MNTSQSTLYYDEFAEHVQNLKDEIFQILTANKFKNQEKRGAPLLAFGTLTAFSAGTRIACAAGSILGICDGAN